MKLKRGRSLSNYRGNSARGSYLHVLGQQSKDNRIELGSILEPYGRFDSDLQRFCCRDCGFQAETYRGICAHLQTECARFAQ